MYLVFALFFLVNGILKLSTDSQRAIFFFSFLELPYLCFSLEEDLIIVLNNSNVCRNYISRCNAYS